MKNKNYAGGEFLFEFQPEFTEVTEYGIALGDLLSGKVQPHAAGARIDVSFKGLVDGPQIKGEISGIDYVNVRADGRIELHIHAQISTNDGANIAYLSDGIALPQEGTPVLQIRQTVTLVTASPAYEWLNHVYGLVTGTSDPSVGQAHLKLYKT